MDNDHQISKYDRLYGGLHDVCLRSNPSTIKNVELTGRTETFIVETKRHDELGDFVFIEYVDEGGIVTRLALPPKVANVIAAQRARLTARRRSISGRAQAKRRMDRGEMPAFLRKKG